MQYDENAVMTRPVLRSVDSFRKYEYKIDFNLTTNLNLLSMYANIDLIAISFFNIFPTTVQIIGWSD